ncbi:hypothetical protein R3P38DRAFT_156780 [Favolaschia claudopus]|uniref:Uncharacterized protein n=1 Tax=Favolaschia claudopus TaxID=2862362 RepID=A0AAV9ZUW5_9AGAR
MLENDGRNAAQLTFAGLDSSRHLCICEVWHSDWRRVRQCSNACSEPDMRLGPRNIHRTVAGRVACWPSSQGENTLQASTKHDDLPALHAHRGSSPRHQRPPSPPSIPVSPSHIKYASRYAAEAARFMEYLRAVCPICSNSSPTLFDITAHVRDSLKANSHQSAKHSDLPGSKSLLAPYNDDQVLGVLVPILRLLRRWLI